MGALKVEGAPIHRKPAILRWLAAWAGIALGLGAIPAGAEPTPSHRLLPLSFSTPSSRSPLTAQTVEAIQQDSRGFIWLGTSDGLSRYDGYEYVTYHHDPQDPHSLSANYVMDLELTADGTLWIATLSGLDRYEVELDRFHTYDPDPDDYTSLSNAASHVLFEDKARTLWIGTFWGLNRYDRKTDSFVRYNPDTGLAQQTLPVTNILSLAEDHEGHLWIGTRAQGLVRFDPDTGRSSHFLKDPADPSSLSHNEVPTILVDPQGVVWVGTYGGLDRYDPESGGFTHIRHRPGETQGLAGNLIESLWLDKDGVLWIGTDGAGLDGWIPGSDTFVHHRFNEFDPTGIGSDVVRELFSDDQHNLWLGLYAGGVQLHNPLLAPFHHTRRSPGRLDDLSHSTVLSFAEEPDGTLWVGTEDGLNRRNEQTDTYEKFLHDPLDSGSLSAKAVLSLLLDDSLRLWVGTYFGGLNLFEPQTGTFRHFSHNEDDPESRKHPGNPHIWSIHQDQKGILWLGTFGGLDRFDPEQEVFEHFRHDPMDPTTLPHELVWQVRSTRDGQVWAATHGGLAQVDPDTTKLKGFRPDPDDPSSLPFNRILAICEDQNGILWLGTEGGGLIRFDRSDESFRSIRRSDGLVTDSILAIQEAGDGNLWLASNQGLSRFEPDSGNLVHFDGQDGLQASTFKLGSSFQARNGDLVFGTTRGYLRFTPEDVRTNTKRPALTLTGFELFGREVSPGESSPLKSHISVAPSIQLRHDQSVFQFTFSALDYRSPQKSLYRYKLEGFDRDWTEPSHQRTATYTNLDPGTYAFRVIAGNSHGLWNEEGIRVPLVVAPPFWQTLWFRTATLLLGAMILAGAYLVRTTSIRRHNRALRREIAERKTIEKRHENLVEELELRNAELERFTYTVSHDLKTPLVTIQGFIGALEEDLEAGDDKNLTKDIHFIKTSATRMSDLLGELLVLSRVGRVDHEMEELFLNEIIAEALAVTAGPILERKVHVVVSPGLPKVMGNRSRLLEVFQNLIDNSVKFMGDTPDPCIEIGATRRDEPPTPEQILCWVRDNGMGIAEEHQDQVFGLFKRLSNDNTGTGIGLALVKRIIEVHGGSIWIESEGEQKGTTFFFLLSAAP